MVIPLSPERLAEVQQELRAQFRESAPAVKNRDAVAHFTATGTFVYRGRRYVAKPVGYQAGVDLQLAQLRAQELQGQPDTVETMREFARMADRLARIFDRHARPVSLWRRLLRPVLGNPFRDMTESEAGTLHGFFSGCRTRSSVMLDYTSAESVQTPT
jgi:hypothetical protein